ncbi:hypothetical protein ACLOJK_034833 [Asimina triloba]
MGRSPCCSKEGLNRGAWSATEDKILSDYIKAHGEGRWRSLPKKAGLKRCGKSCRLRWLNYLRPDIKRGNISHEEEELIVRLHRLLGNRWSLIAGRLPGRTDNEIKNYWNTNLGKKVKGQSVHVHKKQDMKPSADASEEKLNSIHAIRTKALRCTKQFTAAAAALPPQQAAETVETTKLNHDSDTHFAIESKSYEFDESWPSSLMNFDVGQLSLSDLLNSELFEFYDGAAKDRANEFCVGGCNHVSSLQSNDEEVVLREAVVEDWMVGYDGQPDIDSDLQSLTSFLDSEEGWLSR